MDDFNAAAKKLSTDGKFGVGVTPGLFAQWVASSGASYVKADGSYDFTNPDVVKAVEKLVGLVSADKVAPAVASASADDVNMGRFQSGDVAMYVDGPWAVISTKGTVKFNLGLLPVPAAPNGLSLTSGAGFGIWAGSAHKDEAWKAVQVITSPDALAILGKSGRALPARSAAAEVLARLLGQGHRRRRQTRSRTRCSTPSRSRRATTGISSRVC